MAKSIARQTGLSPAQAADRLDRIVHQIVSNLRKRGEANLPGLGKFTHGTDGKVLFEMDTKHERD